MTPVYDLGSCDEDRTATAWTVSKAIANQPDEKQFLGYPLRAVTKDLCSMCGPYQLLQKCKGLPMQSNWGCGEKKVTPGWTKLPATIAEYPEQSEEDSDNEASLIDRMAQGMNLEDEEFDALKQDPDPKGHCGTFIVDGETAVSWWYFLKVGA
jgi:hypothetical protein